MARERGEDDREFERTLVELEAGNNNDGWDDLLETYFAVNSSGEDGRWVRELWFLLLRRATLAATASAAAAASSVV